MELLLLLLFSSSSYWYNHLHIFNSVRPYKCAGFLIRPANIWKSSDLWCLQILSWTIYFSFLWYSNLHAYVCSYIIKVTWWRLACTMIRNIVPCISSPISNTQNWRLSYSFMCPCHQTKFTENLTNWAKLPKFGAVLRGIIYLFTSYLLIFHPCLINHQKCNSLHLFLIGMQLRVRVLMVSFCFVGGEMQTVWYEEVTLDSDNFLLDTCYFHLW